MSIISICLKEDIPDSKEKHADTHGHKITWYDLVYLALRVVETNLRKIQAFMVDLNSVKPRYREFCRLERKKYGK